MKFQVGRLSRADGDTALRKSNIKVARKFKSRFFLYIKKKQTKTKIKTALEIQMNGLMFCYWFQVSLYNLNLQ